MLDERQRIQIERAENKAAIRFDARHLGEIVFRIAQIGGVAFRPGHAAQPAVIEKIPAVIGALERFAVAFVPAAQSGAAMRAAIVQRADFALGVAHDDERTQAKPPRDEVVDVRNLAFVRQIGPGPAEDMRHLGFENRRVGVDQAVRLVLLHQIIPVVERRAADPGRGRADFLERRHGAILVFLTVRRLGTLGEQRVVARDKLTEVGSLGHIADFPSAVCCRAATNAGGSENRSRFRRSQNIRCAPTRSARRLTQPRLLSATVNTCRLRCA